MKFNVCDILFHEVFVFDLVVLWKQIGFFVCVNSPNMGGLPSSVLVGLLAMFYRNFTQFLVSYLLICHFSASLTHTHAFSISVFLSIYVSIYFRISFAMCITPHTVFERGRESVFTRYSSYLMPGAHHLISLYLHL